MVRNGSRFNTRWTFAAFLITLAVLLIAAAGFAVTHLLIQAWQENLEKNLAAERLAVYRAVLQHWMSEGNGTRRNLYLADRTDSLDISDLRGSDCRKSLNMEQLESMYQYHFLADDLAQFGAGKIILVDSEEYEKTVSKYDPQTRIFGKNKDRIEVRDDQVGKIVEEAFDNGLFSLSEIHFDKEMKHAVVAYSFVCGGLCGGGETMLMEKKYGVWIHKSYCGGWVS